METKIKFASFRLRFDCNHPFVFYYLNNYKIPVKTQHIVSIMFYSDMFRLEGIIIRLTPSSRNMLL